MKTKKATRRPAAAVHPPKKLETSARSVTKPSGLDRLEALADAAALGDDDRDFLTACDATTRARIANRVARELKLQVLEARDIDAAARERVPGGDSAQLAEARREILAERARYDDAPSEPPEPHVKLQVAIPRDATPGDRKRIKADVVRQICDATDGQPTKDLGSCVKALWNARVIAEGTRVEIDAALHAVRREKVRRTGSARVGGVGGRPPEDGKAAAYHWLLEELRRQDPLASYEHLLAEAVTLVNRELAESRSPDIGPDQCVRSGPTPATA